VALIEMTEPGVGCGADVAGGADGAEPAVAVATAVPPAVAVAVVPAVAVAMGVAFALAAVAAVADRVPVDLVDAVAWAAEPRRWVLLPVGGEPVPAETVAGALPSGWETVPPQLSGRQFRVRTVPGWPGQTRNTPTVKAAIPAAATPAAALVERNRCEVEGSSRWRPAAPPGCSAAVADADGGVVSWPTGAAGNHADALPSFAS